MQATRILAIRHGQTAWNRANRVQGQLDIPLDPTGRWQAKRMAAALAEEPVRSIYSSDLRRALETSQALATATGLPVRTDAGLREREFGRFQGMTFVEIEAAWPEQSLRWRRRDPVFAPQGGESLLRFRERVTHTAELLAARHPGELIVLVTHGGVLDVLYRAATRQELQAPRTWMLANAAVNRLLWTPQGFSLVGWADTTHLDDEHLDETTA
jgi:probable phosphoglycerate mutase